MGFLKARTFSSFEEPFVQLKVAYMFFIESFFIEQLMPIKNLYL